jgi:hypothetical protein
MTERDMITMSQKELRRLHVVRKVIDKELKQKQAAGVLKLSIRQTRRIIIRIRSQGDQGILHRSRGRASHNAWDEKEKLKIKDLCEKRYAGFGPTLLSEKLFEHEKISISDETLRAWLMGWGFWRRRLKKSWHRHWRERKNHRGEMIQMDGSHHDWLEGRGPKIVLMGYVDDANNELFGRFYDYEGTIPALDSFKRYIRRYGMPQSVYLDKHSTYKSQAKPSVEDDLKGQQPLSQFERALKELGVDVIHAHSPQAKGRVERVFRTLQDRLVKELRLKNAATKDEANSILEGYLPVFNQRFRQAPAAHADLHRRWMQGKRLDDILCIKTYHPVRNDHTLVHQQKLYQVLEKTTAKEARIEEKVDGRLCIKVADRTLRYRLIKQRPDPVKPPKLKGVRMRKRYVPPYDRGWRRFNINHVQNNTMKSGHFNLGKKRTF